MSATITVKEHHAAAGEQVRHAGGVGAQAGAPESDPARAAGSTTARAAAGTTETSAVAAI
jgi:hypothetical protein